MHPPGMEYIPIGTARLVELTPIVPLGNIGPANFVVCVNSFSRHVGEEEGRSAEASMYVIDRLLSLTKIFSNLGFVRVVSRRHTPPAQTF
jgi:hypothetical protein